MLVFGPTTAIPKDNNFVVFNLSSPIETIPRLPGLFVIPSHLNNPAIMRDRDRFEKEFDFWYYNYIINDAIACSSLMTILMTLYDGKNVYICITDYISDDIISTLNESFMKFIQSRYDIKYSRINVASDLDYIPKDGCDFASVNGIMTFDQDRKDFIKITEEQRLSAGGSIYG